MKSREGDANDRHMSETVERGVDNGHDRSAHTSNEGVKHGSNGVENKRNKPCLETETGNSSAEQGRHANDKGVDFKERDDSSEKSLHAQNDVNEIKNSEDDKEDGEVGDGEADGEEDGEAEDEDEDEDDEPPTFKYKRVTGLPPNLFNRDPVSSVCFQDSVIIFGTHSGIIHICDKSFTAFKTFKAHRASVLSIYTDGEYFASGSMDGTIVIGSFLDERDIIAYDFKRPIHAVVLEKDYRRTRSFYSGGMSGKVIFSSKNWLNQKVDDVLDNEAGPIVGMKRLDDVLIWFNDRGINFYNTTLKRKITTIERSHDSPRGDLYWPRIYFPEVDRVLIAWGNFIWTLRIAPSNFGDLKDQASPTKSRILPSASTISLRGSSEKVVETISTYKIDELIAGISSFKDDYILVLTYQPPSKDESKKLVFSNPDLKLINSVTGEVDFEEEIGLRDSSNLGLNDYSLETTIGPKYTKYYVISAKDAVSAQELQLQDKLEWYVEKENFLEAWKIGTKIFDKSKQLNLGIQHADQLLKHDKWYEASLFLKDILAIDLSMYYDNENDDSLSVSDSVTMKLVDEVKQQWENWANIFIKSNHIKELTSMIPSDPRLNLSPHIYNCILTFWLNLIDQEDKFFELTKTWSIELYDVDYIEKEIESKIFSSNDTRLQNVLITLYIESGDVKKAVPLLMETRAPDVLEYLARYHLIGEYQSQLPCLIRSRFTDGELEKLPIEILKYKSKDIISLLIENRHYINTTEFILEMKNSQLEAISYFYLENLLSVEHSMVSNFSNDMIELYVKFDRSKLLSYLIKSDSYDIDHAISLCEKNEYTEELIYLLGKIGQLEQALKLIINDLNDPELAIDFAKQQNDKKLWKTLLDYSMTKPLFIKALIECADEQSNYFYDPASIIEKLPEDVEVEGLKKSVTNISFTNALTLLINQYILRIIYKDSAGASRFLREKKLEGYLVNINDYSPKLLQKFRSLVLYSKGSGSLPALTLESLIIEGEPEAHNYTAPKKLQHIAHLKKILAQGT